MFTTVLQVLAMASSSSERVISFLHGFSVLQALTMALPLITETSNCCASSGYGYIIIRAAVMNAHSNQGRRTLCNSERKTFWVPTLSRWEVGCASFGYGGSTASIKKGVSCHLLFMIL